MAKSLVSSPDIPTLGALLTRLGGIPAERVRFYPLPGTASVDDVVQIHEREGRLCELVEGVLVEKAIGYHESFLAAAIASALRAFVVPRRLGYVNGAAGMVQLVIDLVRGPDVSFVSRARLPDGLPDDPIPLLVPDLVVEVLSRCNTKKEMDRKLSEYFAAGVRLVWYVDIHSRTVSVYHSVAEPTILSIEQVLDGGEVLPGFSLPLAPLFAELDN